MKLKETVAYKCGYDSGRAEALAEVVTMLEDLPFEEQVLVSNPGGHYTLHWEPINFVKDAGIKTNQYIKKSWLLAKLTAEVKDDGA